MANDTREEVHPSLAARGVSRRDFLKFCAGVAATLGISELAAPRIALALGEAFRLKPVLWLSQGLCTGCTESMAQSSSPDVPSIVLDLLSINYWETVMAAAGEAAEKAKADTIEAGGYLAIVEGSVMTGEKGNTLRIAGKTGLEALEEATKKADAVIAVGSCAVDGGWVRADPNQAGAKGVDEVVTDKPVINLPTCPVNPAWVVTVLTGYLLSGALPELDEKGRPRIIFGKTIHDDCPRRGHFENGEFVQAFGSKEEAQQWCLYKLGCKGPQTRTNCPSVRWNRRVSWCVESGSPCIGCGNLDWVDRDAPFFARMPDVAGVSPETIGAGLGALTLTGLVVHGIVQTATGRLGHGTPEADETEKGADER